MGRLQNNPSIGWVHPKSTHAHPLAWGNKKGNIKTWQIFVNVLGGHITLCKISSMVTRVLCFLHGLCTFYKAHPIFIKPFLTNNTYIAVFSLCCYLRNKKKQWGFYMGQSPWTRKLLELGLCSALPHAQVIIWVMSSSSGFTLHVCIKPFSSTQFEEHPGSQFLNGWSSKRIMAQKLWEPHLHKKTTNFHHWRGKKRFLQVL